MKYKFIKEVRKVEVIRINEGEIKELKKIIFMISFFYYFISYLTKFRNRGHIEFFGENYRYDSVPLHNMISVTLPKKFGFTALKVKDGSEVIVSYSGVIEEKVGGEIQRKYLKFSIMLTRYLYEKTANKEV